MTMMINITFPDGNVRQYEPGSSALDIARSISEGLARNVVSATVNGQLTDRDLPLSKNATLALHTWNDQAGKETFWHSTAHLMAEALEAMYPGIKFGYGPSSEKGFFYDVEPPAP
jgi:threonyl-tRNA synthetase